MSGRVTQQVATTGFVTDPTVRVTSMAVEVIRTTAGSPIAPAPTGRRTIVIVAAS